MDRASLQGLFPEYEASDLRVGRDRFLILSRVLDRGGREEIHWAFRRYRTREIVEFLREDGQRLLSPRSRRFWRLAFRMRLSDSRGFPGGLDRDLGRELGGAG